MSTEELASIAECMSEELQGSRNYYWKAIRCKHDCPDVASMYASMASQELEHAIKLNQIAMRLATNEQRQMWDVFRSMLDKSTVEIKVLQETYKS